VETDVLRWMVEPDENIDWGLGYEGYTNEKIAKILDKAADIGLLTAHGGGYTIHPALPWFFKSLFEQYYPSDDDRPLTADDGTIVIRPSSMVALRAFVESMGELGDYYFEQYEGGNRDVIALLRAEESNLLHAYQLARQHDWWNALIKIMQGFFTLYSTSRRAEWKRLVDDIVPIFVDSQEAFIIGRESALAVINKYRIELARESHNLGEAERILRKSVDWDRQRISNLLTQSPNTLSPYEKKIIRSLAVSLNDLAKVLRDQDNLECFKLFEEADKIYSFIDDKTPRANNAINFGNVFLQTAFRSLDKAEMWFRLATELYLFEDKRGQSGALVQLGSVYYERFIDAKKEGKPEEELLKHLNTAADYYQQALALLPPDIVDYLAIIHNQLGNIYVAAKDFERALNHYSNAAKFFELAGDLYNAATVKHNVSIALYQNGRLSDALLYARAALRDFESYGGRAKDKEDQTKELIDWIEKEMNR
jgi:tetratricopeptide (TPR) repeat protein